MIIFDGIKTINKTKFLCFKNELNERVEIPLEKIVVERITKYLSRITVPAITNIQRGNDEEAE